MYLKLLYLCYLNLFIAMNKNVKTLVFRYNFLDVFCRILKMLEIIKTNV